MQDFPPSCCVPGALGGLWELGEENDEVVESLGRKTSRVLPHRLLHRRWLRLRVTEPLLDPELPEELVEARFEAEVAQCELCREDVEIKKVSRERRSTIVENLGLGLQVRALGSYGYGDLEG